MSRTFLCADHHFWHRKVCTVFDRTGKTKLRPWDEPQPMNEHIIERHNAVVRDSDCVVFVGDVAMHDPKYLSILSRLRGRKELVMGNHDQFDCELYARHFSKIVSSLKLGGYLVTHIPVHPGNLENRWKGNIHGHLHDRQVLLEDGSIDPRYFCVSMERIDYTPVTLEHIDATMRARAMHLERMLEQRLAASNRQAPTPNPSNSSTETLSTC